MPAPPCRARRSPLRRRSRHLVCPLTADRAARRPQQRAGRRRVASLRVPGAPVAAPAPERAIGVFPDDGPSGASAGAAGGASADGFSARAGVPGAPVATSAPKSVLGVFPDGGPPDASAGAAAHTPPRTCSQPPPIPAAAPHSRGGPAPHLATRRRAAAVIATRSPGGAAPLPICCRSTTCCQSPRAVARSHPTWLCAALLIIECATATDRLLRRSPRFSASSALPPRHSTALADSLQVVRRGYTSQPREPREPSGHPCIFATASSDPGRSLSMRSRTAMSSSPVNDSCRLRRSHPVVDAGRCVQVV